MPKKKIEEEILAEAVAMTVEDEEALVAEAILAQEDAAAEEKQQVDQLNELAGDLSRLALDQVSKRKNIEERWRQDTLQYNGEYDAGTAARLRRKTNRSKAYLKITRSKTNAAEARLGDMLFPTDDRNWAIQPTPVPTMQKQAANTAPWVGDPVVDAAGVAQMGPDGKPVMQGRAGPGGQPMTVAEVAQAELAKAREAAENMQREIDDQLNEANYPLKARSVIHDACVLGTGVMKGPVVVARTRKTFQKKKGPDGSERWALTVVRDPRPNVERVSPWDFFPDMSPIRFEDSEFVFERSWPTKSKMREYLKNPTFVEANVREVLKKAPAEYYLADTALNEIRDGSQTDRTRYEQWEYHGPIKREALLAAGLRMDLIEMFPDAASDDDLPDEIPGCVVFCCGIVIKAYINPLDSGDLPYSVMVLEPDETSVFGYGIPYLMRDTQKAINSAWRMILDNAALSAGPQLIVNKDLVSPANGVWDIEAMKLWLASGKDVDIRAAFGSFNIDSRIAELDQIRETAMRMADEETNLPLIAQGNQTGAITRTAQGMSMLMNAANVVLRRSVKAYDDGITKPLLTRFYHYNMQHSQDESIKGDFEVDARGSSVLLAKEIESQNLMQLAFNFSAHPVFGPLIKPAALLRKVIKSLSIAQDDVVKTDAEMSQEAATKANQPQAQQPTPEQIKADSAMQLAQFNRDTELAVMEARERISIRELQAKGMITAAQMQQEMAMVDKKYRSEETQQAREMKFKMAFGSGI